MYGMPEHPRDTMDDLTSVSCTEEMEKVNTIRITKSTEMRSRTFLSVVVGGIAGAVLCLVFYPLMGSMGAVFILIGMLLTPFMAVGRVRDRTQQVRWRRSLNSLRSARVEGRAFFPNSTRPENITRLEGMVFRP